MIESATMVYGNVEKPVQSVGEGGEGVDSAIVDIGR